MFLRKEFLFVLGFQDRVSLCNPSGPGTHMENKQAGLAMAPSSASRELGWWACALMPGLQMRTVMLLKGSSDLFLCITCGAFRNFCDRTGFVLFNSQQDLGHTLFELLKFQIHDIGFV